MAEEESGYRQEVENLGERLRVIPEVLPLITAEEFFARFVVSEQAEGTLRAIA